LTIDTYIRAQVARFAIEDGARHGGIQNMLAIAHVLRNRVFAGWGDWVEVMQRAPEKRATIYPPYTPDMRGSSIRVFLSRLDEIYTATTSEDFTGGALFYVDPGLPMADWFREQVMNHPEQHPRCSHVGPVWFFK